MSIADLTGSKAGVERPPGARIRGTWRKTALFFQHAMIKLEKPVSKKREESMSAFLAAMLRNWREDTANAPELIP
ncbi:MAG: hypothetical protein ABIO86_13210 [Sphingomonas sp.]